MAPNKFATMLHKNSNKMTIILVYAVLEWVLILLLLLNSLFWYLICKFAKYFGLKPPCLWCSRVDHFLEPNDDNRHTYRELICEEHAAEISRLGYCTSHHRLAESRNMCTDCSSICSGRFIEMSPKVAFFTWVGENVAENDQENNRCCCCDEIMSIRGFSFYPSCLLLKPSWGVLDYADKNHLIAQVLDNEGENLDKSKSDFQEHHCKNEFIEKSEVDEDPNVESFSFGSIIDIAKDNSDTELNDKSFDDDDDARIQIFHRDDESLEVMNLSFPNSECCDFDRLIPVELIDSSTVTSQRSGISVEDDVVVEHNHLKRGNDCVPAASKQPEEEKDPCDLFGDEITPQTPTGMDLSDQPEEQTHPLARLQLINSPMDNGEIKIITDLDASIVQKGQGAGQVEKAIIQETTVFARNSHSGKNHNLPANLEPEMVEEENSPLVSTYMAGAGEHQLTKKKELEAEESWDGSVISEVQGVDGGLTIERLKSELEAERKALTSLQAELEEERNAAAIAANQTLAMITRLQEEKSAMQMEALHYQRMMEEQSEYDQEALQLLNDLIIKREKEKQELEKELDMCHKKVLDYEAKERMMSKTKCRSTRSRNSTASSINVEENDELFIDLQGDDGRLCAPNDNNHGEVVLDLEETGLDCIKHMSVLDESIAEFEDERMSILEELKALEQKLFTLADDDEHLFEDIKLTEHFTDAYGQEFDESYKCSSPDENGKFSGDLNGDGLLEKKALGSTAKRLLPLFDEAGLESEEDVKSQSTGMRIALLNKFELENNRVTIEDEVDHVYERLQALEADKEFLKHCFSSLKKGDKGMDLLEEILEHLRDLRTVELRVRNCGDSPLACCSS